MDSLFSGNLIGSNGLAVASLSTPVFLLYALLGLTIGVGANVHIGRLLGSSDVNGANSLFHSQIGLGLIVGLLSLSPLLFKDAYFTLLGVTEELYPLAEQYLTVVMWAAPVFVMYHILSVSVRTDSDPRLATIASVVVIGTNLTLDFLFMKVLDWGIIGASASLCIAEGLGVLVLLTHFLKKQRLLTLRVSLPRLSDIKKIVYNGFGVGSANIFIAIVMRVFNALLLYFGGDMGTTYVGIYGVIYTISMIPVGVFDGTSNALSTVTAFFVGESDEKGIFTVLKKALSVAIIGGGVIAFLCAVFSNSLVWFFGIRDAAALESAAEAMRIFAISIVFTGINTVITAFWQSIGRARLAGVMSAIRNCILLLAVGVLLIPGVNIFGLAISYICTEVVCTLIVILVSILRSSRKYVSEKYGLKGKCFERSYLIETESMTHISGDLEALCEEWEIGMKQSFFINFVCEELLLNVIKFGLDDRNKKNKSYYVSIKLMEKDGDYVLRIRDNVSSYNPFESDGDEIDSGVLTLIQKKTKYCDYQRKMIFNYLYMII
jgi:Na+-driven multidrug efflux pump